ncbi:MAG: TSUP family transporter [Acidimicrobiales bacterium]|jgi:uncharacterized membrane protein YfcA
MPNRMEAPASVEAVEVSRRRRYFAWGISLAITVVWTVAVLVTGSGRRVLDSWESAVTMLFGSFLAGSSPAGGGSVAFPVFTKVLNVSAPVARTFGLCIQAVGMGVAVAAIFLFKRKIHARATIVATISALVGFAAAVLVMGEPDKLFWPSSIGTPWVKATFSILLAATSLMMIRHLRHGDHDPAPLSWNHRLESGLVVAAAIGGFVSALAGTGANIMVFLFLVVVANVNPKVALSSAIIVMAAVSMAGLVLFGLVDDQLNVVVTDGVVTSVGGFITSLGTSEADLLGLWLAAVPVVVWGAPLGSLAASLIPERRLVQFVALLAGIEVITTFILVSELRSDWALLAYLICGLVALPSLLIALARHRRTIFASA